MGDMHLTSPEHLVPGFAFSPTTLRIGEEEARRYLHATDPQADQPAAMSGNTPALCIAALALRDLLAALPPDPGMVHLSQDYTTHCLVPLGTPLTLTSTIAGRTQRRSATIVTIAQTIQMADGSMVLSGKSMVMLAAPAPAGLGGQ